MSEGREPVSRKVIVIGPIGVGKTSLVRRLVHRVFESDYLPTVGFDIYTHTVPAQATGLEHDVNLVVWDTDGDFGLGVFKMPFAKGASAAVIVGDVVRRSSLEDMARLAAEFREQMPGREYMFIINKVDLIEGKPRPELPKGLESSHRKPFWTSAKEDRNVDETFVEIAQAVARRGY